MPWASSRSARSSAATQRQLGPLTRASVTRRAILGETHTFAPTAATGVWMSTAGLLGLGVCGEQVAGRRRGALLARVQRDPSCTPARRCASPGVPATGQARSACGRADRARTRRRRLRPGGTADAPVAGRDGDGGGATATTGADGKATLTLARTASDRQATQPGTVRSPSAATSASSTGVRRRVRSPAPAGGARHAAAPCRRQGHDRADGDDRRPPQERSRAGAARASCAGRSPPTRPGSSRCGSPSPGAARRGAAPRSTARASASSAHRCGGWKSFRIGDRADWCYLLPKRLRPRALHHPSRSRSTRPATTARRRRGSGSGEACCSSSCAGAVLGGAGDRVRRVGRRDGRRQARGARARARGHPQGAQRDGRRPPLRARRRRRRSPSSRARACRSACATTGPARAARATRARSTCSRSGRTRARGRDGWVYKVGNRSGSAGAADPGGSFGTGRTLRGGERVLWFWCVKDRRDACQRTLADAPRTPHVAARSTSSCAASTTQGRGKPRRGRDRARSARRPPRRAPTAAATLAAPARPRTVSRRRRPGSSAPSRRR